MHRKRTQIINNRNNLLESEIKHRTKDLEKANEAQLKIFTIIAHDLNNPLAALKDINDKVKFLIGKNRLKDIDLLTEQTNDRINALNDNLSNLLQWAVNETNLSPVTKEKLSVRLEIDKIIKIYTCRINEKNLRLVVNLDAVDQVYMNVAVLQTVLRNVISNAIKFSKDSGAIYIQKVSESASFLSISIKDEGIGMDQSSKTQNGAGIGLMISKELALKSNLCLDFLSNDSGTEVIIQLPIV